MATITQPTVSGNTAPPLTITCERPDGTIINLTNCTIALVIKSLNTNAVTNSGHQSATISSPATAGIITYVRQAGDVPTAGSYMCEVHVTYADNTVEVLYDLLKLKARTPLQ